MESLAEVQRQFFDGLYTNRIAVAVASIVVATVIFVIAWRLGWFATARRHPGRSGLLVALALGVGLPLTWYLASPIWIRSELVEPEPAAEVAAPVSAAPSTGPVGATASAKPQPTPFATRTIATGEFDGTDDFHFGRGTARIVETAQGPTPSVSPTFRSGTAPTSTSICRPSPRAMTKAPSNWGSSRRPTAPSAMSSRRAPTLGLRERDHLVQTVLAPLRGRAVGRYMTVRPRRKSGIGKRGGSAYLTAVNATDGSVARPVARRKLGLLSRLTRENPTGSRRLPRGVWLSCTTTRT